MEGRKDDQGKLRYDLMSVDALRGLTEVLTFGSSKYSDRNWQKGIDFNRLYRATLAHLLAFWKRKDIDDDSAKLAIDHAQCCVHFLSHYLHNYELYKKFDNRTDARGGGYGDMEND